MLKELRTEVIKTKPYRIKVCRECWDPDHPQLQLGMYPVNDPQAVREPRPDVSYYASGNNGLLVNQGNGINYLQAGDISGGSRVFQWGWNPVGGASSFDTVLTLNYLIAIGQVGTVTISTT